MGKPIGGGDELFCHVRALLDGEGSVQEGNKVSYTPRFNARQGKMEAGDVRLVPGGDGDFREELLGPPPGVEAPPAGEGVIMRWMGDRGFGFVKPIAGGDELFCHARSLVNGDGSVEEGNKVTFVPKWNDRQSKFEAGEVQLAPGGEGDHRPEVEPQGEGAPQEEVAASE